MAGTKGMPRFSQALLAEHTEGLVALSGCRDGELVRRFAGEIGRVGWGRVYLQTGSAFERVTLPPELGLSPADEAAGGVDLLAAVQSAKTVREAAAALSEAVREEEVDEVDCG